MARGEWCGGGSVGFNGAVRYATLLRRRDLHENEMICIREKINYVQVF